MVRNLKTYLTVALLLLAASMSGRENRYLFDIGVLGGGSYYVGDATPHIFQHVRPAYGAELRYKINYRWSLTAKAVKSDIRFNYTEPLSGYEKSGSNDLLDIDLTAEYNFFQLATGWVDRYSHPFSPYIFVGIGMNTQKHGQPISPYIPFGIGFKWRFTPRWSLECAWQHQLQLNDNLEGIDALNNTHNMNGSDFFHNDLFSTFTLGVSFGFWRAKGPCRICDENNRQQNNGSMNDWIGF